MQNTANKRVRRNNNFVSNQKKTKKTTSTKKKAKKRNWSLAFLKSERAIQVYGIIVMATAFFIAMAIVSAFFHYHNDNPHVVGSAEQVHNWLGSLGAHVASVFVKFTFGVFSIGIPFLLFIYGVRIAFKKSILPLFHTTITTIVSMAWLSTMLGCFFNEGSKYYDFAGDFGNTVASFLLQKTHIWGTSLILLTVLFLVLVLFYKVSPLKVYHCVAKMKVPIKATYSIAKSLVLSLIHSTKKVKKGSTKSRIVKTTSLPQPAAPQLDGLYTSEMNVFTNEINTHASDFQEEVLSTKVDFNVEGDENAQVVPTKGSATFEIIENEELGTSQEELLQNEVEVVNLEENKEEVQVSAEAVGTLEEYDPRSDLSMYQFPPIELMNDYGAGEQKQIDKTELNQNKEKIERTLNNFGIKIKHISANIGPTVTLYEIVPEDGVRISKIKGLENDIALSLAALGIRIIAPIPGKGTIGIEVPNNNPQIVSMREVIASEKFQNSGYELPIGIGKTISNSVFVVDLAKMPHLLMAGATGQGKSVGLNAIIASLLYKKHPAELKFVLVDPKKVEFSLYSTIENHYLAKLPDSDDAVITDTKEVVKTLNSLCKEMDMRYDLLKVAKAKNIKEYNQKFCSRRLSPALGHRYLPYIVLVIDEFGDLIMTAGRDVEVPIARLAQLARAIGIHLIIATQRPSVNIITGTIKANFPSRLAFRVASKIDSRTILDGNGADQLIGKGDLLFSTGSDLIRLQCAFIDTPEVEKIAQFIEEQQSYFEAFQLPEFVLEDKKGGFGDDDFGDSQDIDAMFIEAAHIMVQSQMGSTSQIQRKLKLGYNRAGRIMDQLEEFKIVGPSVGSKAREVYPKTIEELNAILQRMGLL